MNSMEDFVYSRIGMALVSAQRVEFVAHEILVVLREYDREVYGITTEEFLGTTPEAEKLRRATLGRIFTYLKLNPKLVLADELSSYLGNRNILAHGFWKTYMQTKSKEQVETAFAFLQSFGESSQKLERFFNGFLYLLALRHVKEREDLAPEFKQLSSDFDYFMESIEKKKLL
jgi:hypothetical protein